ncbi:MAG TPA: hypothetical protein VEV45_21010 [Streptosporangiaceae bacterium]|nr:hypothetical protein [Streptosporangiaceae bacterium]
MPVAARGYSDGPRVTVNELLKDPLVIPQLILDMTQNEFVMDSVLRDGGAAPSGAVRYSESTPMYADDNPEIRAEFGEVPIVPTSIGIPRVVFSHERAMAIMVSDEMRRRQSVDPVTRQLTQVKNTMVFSWNTAFYSAVVANANIQTLAVANTWASAGATIRADLAQACYLVENANVVSPSGLTQWLGFEADTLIINHGSKNTLLQSNTFAAPYIGDIASENLLYTGTLPQKILTLDVMVSRQVPAGNAIVMQRRRAGFFADELPYVAGPLYRDEPRKTWRSDTQRASAIGLDQPLSIVLMSGV